MREREEKYLSKEEAERGTEEEEERAESESESAFSLAKATLTQNHRQQAELASSSAATAPETGGRFLVSKPRLRRRRASPSKNSVGASDCMATRAATESACTDQRAK